MLTGIRILDLSRILAGPLCTMMLGDLGADVLKIERPDGGDETRAWGPPFDQHGQSAYFLSVNRNKKSVAADLHDPDDRALIARLIREADVVVDNFRPGTLDRFGLAPTRCLVDRPHLVWCTITGFGPHSRRPGYDFVVQAECGWMAITGTPEGPPTKAGVALADVIAGTDAVVAILAALLARTRTGHGRHVTISLAASAAAALVNVAQNALVTGSDARRWGNAHPNLVPYQLFDAADRPLVIAVGSDAQWRSCALALGLPDLAADSRLHTNAGRLAHRALVVETLAHRLAQHPAATWLATLHAAHVPCGIVKGVLEVLHEVEGSATTGIAPSIPGHVRLAPPRLDEHGSEVRRLGWAAFPA